MLRGLAPDGGLYVPTRIPAGDDPAGPDFADHAAALLLPWLRAEFGEGEAEATVRSALDFPVRIVEPSGGTFVVELFHGPTLSFKDFGARTMARLVQASFRSAPSERTIFVATSGDTGSAVADGFSGMSGVRVVLLYPAGQVSLVQERQIAATRPGVLAVRVHGSFDDCQRMVKAVFADPRFDRFAPTSANSINVGRLLPQATYHAWAASRVPDAVLVVPSGNLGNLTAAVLARLSGAPVRALVAAHNANRAFPRYLEGGPRPAAPSVRTLSNAMDVGAPSNFERLEALLGAGGMRREIRGLSISDDDTIGAMRRTFEETGYVSDPHTAVGLEAVRRLATEGLRGPFLVMATAHPAKFPETVERAVGRRVPEPASLAALGTPDVRAPRCEASVDDLLELLLDASRTGPALNG
jgi:threonine synthase